MRNLFLVLLLANLLLLAWQRWVLPPPADDPFAMAGTRDPQLVLLAPAEPAVADLAPAGCFRVGPFEDPAVSREAAESLTAEGLPVFRYSESGEIWVGHWVQVVDLDGREAADTALDRLAEAGRSDAYIVRGDDGYRISLGVFRSLEGAERVANQAIQAGLTTLTTDRFRAGNEYWLLVGPAGAGMPDLARLGLSGPEILRAEPAPCRGGGNGGPGPDSLESAPPGPE